MREINHAMSTLLVALVFFAMLFPSLPKWVRLGVAGPAWVASCILIFWSISVPISRDQEFVLGFGSCVVLLAVLGVYFVRKPWVVKAEAAPPMPDKPTA